MSNYDEKFNEELNDSLLCILRGHFNANIRATMDLLQKNDYDDICEKQFLENWLVEELESYKD